MSDVTIHTDLSKYKTALRFISNTAFPESVAHALNSPAKAIEKQARRNFAKNMIVRRAFTLNSIKQDRFARGANIGRMFSRVGTATPYVAIHEDGATVQAKNSKLAIPFIGSARAGNIKTSILRRYAMNRIGDLQASKRYFIGTPKGRSNLPGIWERINKNKKIRRLRHIDSSSVRIKARPWFEPAVRKFGTIQYVQNKFLEKANVMLRTLRS